MFWQMMQKFSLIQVQILNQKFTIANSFYYFKFDQTLDGKACIMSLLGAYIISRLIKVNHFSQNVSQLHY